MLTPDGKMKKKKRGILEQLLRSKGDSITKRHNKFRKSEVNQQKTRDSAGSHVIWSPAMDRAQEIRATLSPELPSFSKPVHRSNVAGRFCLYLPKEFCDEHLPNHDDSVVLVDENEQEFHVKYVLLRNKLDGGWRGFANEQKLMEGDALVFQLIDHCKFKVHIVRVPEINGAHGLINLDFHATPIDTDQSGRKRDNFGQNVPKAVKSSKPIVNFKDMKCFEDFEIRVDDLILDQEIPTHLRKKYYDLCCSQKNFLHDNLNDGLNGKLAIGIICETTNIASAIRSANLDVTSLQDLKWWDKTLEALEVLGMSVKFLRDKLHKLIRLASKSKSIIEAKGKKRDHLSDDFISFDATLLKAKVLMNELESEVEALDVKNVKIRFKFKELACAPW